MIIIIEGLDGTGKTTLCKSLEKILKSCTYIHGSYPNSNEEKINRMKQMFEQLFDDRVYLYDRCSIIDEFVYSFLDNNPNSNPFIEYKDIIKAILNHCLILHLTINEKERKKRFLDRGDEYIKQNMIETISKGYVNFYKEMGLFVHLIPLTNDIEGDTEKTLTIIYDFITHTSH